MAKTLQQLLKSGKALVVYPNELGSFTALLAPTEKVNLKAVTKAATEEFITDAFDPVTALGAIVDKVNAR